MPLHHHCFSPQSYCKVCRRHGPPLTLNRQDQTSALQVEQTPSLNSQVLIYQHNLYKYTPWLNHCWLPAWHKRMLNVVCTETCNLETCNPSKFFLMTASTHYLVSDFSPFPGIPWYSELVKPHKPSQPAGKSGRGHLLLTSSRQGPASYPRTIRPHQINPNKKLHGEVVPQPLCPLQRPVRREVSHSLPFLLTHPSTFL